MSASCIALIVNSTGNTPDHQQLNIAGAAVAELHGLGGAGLDVRLEATDSAKSVTNPNGCQYIQYATEVQVMNSCAMERQSIEEGQSLKKGAMVGAA
jgi:hypothetical protein